jgi:hypothetical protein
LQDLKFASDTRFLRHTFVEAEKQLEDSESDIKFAGLHTVRELRIDEKSDRRFKMNENDIEKVNWAVC